MRAKTMFTPTLFMRQRGISLMEALIALAVIGFGFLAVARFQISVFENGDFARQRSEATRLARDRIELIRGFEQIASESGKVAYNDYAATAAYPSMTASQTLPAPQQELIESPYATYTSRWWIAPDAGGNFTMLTVDVSWPNRQGQSESVTLQSMLARAEPKESLGIRFPAAGSPVKKPLDRNLNVPVPAVSLAGGKSGFIPPGATGFYYVFDNASGMVTNVCSGSLPSTNLPVEQRYGCDSNSTNSFVISGYVNFKFGSSPCADVFDNCHADDPMNVTMEIETRCPDASCTYPPLPLAGTDPYKCTIGRAPKTDGNGNVVIEQGNVVYTQALAYTCVVTTHDRGEGTNPRRIWAGQVRLGNIAIGTASNQYKVCRYSDDYDKSGTGTPDVNALYPSNAEHPSIYGLTGVGKPGYMSESLENQNYLVISGNQSCPAQEIRDGSTLIGYYYRTVQHQP